MTAPISNGPTTHGYTTMRDATSRGENFLVIVVIGCDLMSWVNVDDVPVDPLAMFEMEQRVEVFI